MQIKIKKTINNATYEYEVFINKEDIEKINIETVLNLLKFNAVEEVKAEPNNEPAEVKEAIQLNQNQPKKETIAPPRTRVPHDENTTGYYIKFTLGKNLFEKWSKHTSIDRVKANLHDYIWKVRKEKGYQIEYEILEIKPMTYNEYINRNK